jgi:hypothetical protein
MDFTCINLATMDRVSLWMQDILSSLGIEPGSVGVEIQEDETGSAAQGVFVHSTCSIENFCGKAGHKVCELNGFSIPLDRGDFAEPTTQGYDAVCAAFRDNRLGCYTRAMVVHLLIEGPGGLSCPILLAPTCNRFDAAFVRAQEKQIIELWPQTFLKRVGPLVAFGSDGDARRRQNALINLMGPLGEGESRYILGAPSITMGPRQTEGANGAVSVAPSHTQDHIHNVKKGFNAIGSKARTLVIGRFSITMNHFFEVVEYFASEPWRHGLQKGMCVYIKSVGFKNCLTRTRVFWGNYLTRTLLLLPCNCNPHFGIFGNSSIRRCGKERQAEFSLRAADGDAKGEKLHAGAAKSERDEKRRNGSLARGDVGVQLHLLGP